METKHILNTKIRSDFGKNNEGSIPEENGEFLTVRLGGI